MYRKEGEVESNLLGSGMYNSYGSFREQVNALKFAMKNAGFSDHLIKIMLDLYLVKHKYNEKNVSTMSPISPYRNRVELMRQIISELSIYVSYPGGIVGRRIDSFEKKYEQSSVAFALRKDDEHQKKNPNKKNSINLGIVSGMRERYWKSKAKQYEYHSMCGVMEFIRELESILRDIDNRKDIVLNLSSSIERLASTSFGASSIDNENKKLLEQYYACIKEDKINFRKNQREIIEKKYIDSLRETMLYKEKNHVGDSHPIGRKNSRTFSSIFDTLRYHATKKLTVNIEKRDNEVTNNNDYLERIKNLNNMVEFLEHSYDASLKNKVNYSYTLEEQFRLEGLGRDVYSKIAQLKEIYQSILEMKKKNKRNFNYVIALKARKEAIEQTLSSLSYSVLEKTREMLVEEKFRCEEELKKYQELIDTLNRKLEKAEAIRNELSPLMSSFDKIIATAQDRKEKEESERRKKQIADLERAKAKVLALEMEELEKQIDKIKAEIITEMTNEGKGPRAYNFDGERYDEDYTEFNKVFKQRLMERLIELGVKNPEAYLSNPYEPKKNHVKPVETEQIEEQKPVVKKPTVEVDKNGYRKVKKGFYGMYNITEEDYLAIYEKMALEAKALKSDYDPFEIIDRVLAYIEKTYGMDYIENRDEFRKMVRRHEKRIAAELSETREKSKMSGSK